jgi:FkbM family methyltransferase
MMNAYRQLIWYASSRTAHFKGKERLLSLLARPSGPDASVIEREGVKWAVRGHDLNEFAIAVRANHSPALSAALEREIKQRDAKVMWDIGANIGAIALPLMRKFPQLRTCLFEPSAEVAGRLIHNLTGNPQLSERAAVMNFALSDSTGLTSFYVSNEPFNSGTAGLGFSHNRFQMPVWVQAYTGDSLVASGKCAAPDVMKVDVEGFEIEVFRGLRETLALHLPTIIFEHSIYRLKERKLEHGEVARFLQSLGYALFRASDNQPIEPANLDEDHDFIARKA